MSQNRSLAVLEILVHLSSSLPDKYVLGAAEIPDLLIAKLDPNVLPGGWTAMNPADQASTERIGDDWLAERRSAVLAVPSVIVGELNYVLNPAHPDFDRIRFADPAPFQFDLSLIAQNGPGPRRAS